jgi:hypothetical protein
VVDIHAVRRGGRREGEGGGGEGGDAQLHGLE